LNFLRKFAEKNTINLNPRRYIIAKIYFISGII
jgi:hypothetical protein